MKKLFLLMPLLLTSCIPYLYYKDGCHHTPFTTSCDGEGFPLIAKYQKRTTIGNTDPEQRWIDMKKCGVKYGDIHLDSVQRKTLDSVYDDEMMAKFDSCIEKLGYIYIKDCGRMNSVTDKKLCNM